MRRALLAASLMLAFAAHADEGMWTPQQLPEIADALKSRGLQLPVEALADLSGDPLGAIVSLGGCTAGFVSAQGLVATNHHCVTGAIQLNSTPEDDLLRHGFVAESLADERRAGPNARIYVIDRIDEVTDAVLAGVGPDLDGLERQQAIEDAQKALIADCEADGGVRCQIASFFGGLQYRLFRQLEIRDVRLVYAPPESIGAYGGDIDNWMWPRHTGDFAFYRAWVGPDGRPADPSEDNVPYRPAHWLRIGAQGLAEGDFAMVAGYPGRTFRYALADEFDDAQSWNFPTRIALFDTLMALVEAFGAEDRDIEIRYANQMQGWANARKNLEGQLQGFARSGAAARKRAEEQAVLDWLAAKGRDGRAALEAHAALVALIEARRTLRERELVLTGLQSTALLGSAITLHRLALERSKPDGERAAGWQQRDWPRRRGSLEQLERRFHPEVDRALLALYLERYAQLPAEQRLPALDAWLGGLDEKTIGARLRAAYATTRLGDTNRRLGWFEAELGALEASEDPFLQLATALAPALLADENEQRRLAGEDSRLRPLFLQAVIDYHRSQGRAVYPDANGTLRLTFGNVSGYRPRDAVRYEPFTTLAGILEKDTGTAPFDAPPVLLEQARAGRHGGRADATLGDVPVNFLTNLDVTGGNSGSPTLNARGEFVGLVFDMNWESVSSNWLFDPDLTRTIHVDVRYLLWIMEQVFPAPALLREMGVPPVD